MTRFVEHFVVLASLPAADEFFAADAHPLPRPLVEQAPTLLWGDPDHRWKIVGLILLNLSRHTGHRQLLPQFLTGIAMRRISWAAGHHAWRHGQDQHRNSGRRLRDSIAFRPHRGEHT